MKGKAWAFVLALAMMGNQMIWAGEQGSALENVIQEVKQKIEIPAELTDFTYYASEDGYNLSWSEESGEQNINAFCDLDGDLFSYHYNAREEEEGNWSKMLDYAQAKKAAEAFIEKAVPEYAGQLKDMEIRKPGSGSAYSFTYQLMHQGIPVFGQQVTVRVNKYTGKVVSFEGVPYDEQAIYKGESSALDLKEAQNAYLSKVGLPLTYMLYYDYASSKRNVYLAYRIDNEGDLGIDALTGEKVKKYSGTGIGIKECSSTMATEDEGAGNVAAEKQVLTPAEQEAVDAADKFLSAEALKSKWAAYFPALKSMKVERCDTYQSQKEYRRNISCVYKNGEEIEAQAYLSCDAQNGELYSYDYYLRKETDKEDQAAWTGQQAADLIEKINPDKSKKVLMKEEEDRGEGHQQYFEFTRMEEGIPVNGNDISLIYDRSLGRVTSYNVNWENQLDFPSASGVLSKEKAVEKIGLKLCYMQTAAHQYTLVYAHENNNSSFDAFSGQKVNYRGEAIHEESGSFYSDIAGHPREKIITRLYDNGIYLEGPALHPNAAISQKELIRLLEQVCSNYSNDDKLYEKAIQAGILEASEKQPEKLLTREEGIRYMINITPYKKIAALPELYSYPFKGQPVNEEMKGYITLAYGLKLIDGSEFKPDAPLSKAEAMFMIYQLLQLQ